MNSFVSPFPVLYFWETGFMMATPLSLSLSLNLGLSFRGTGKKCSILDFIFKMDFKNIDKRFLCFSRHFKKYTFLDLKRRDYEKGFMDPFRSWQRSREAHASFMFLNYWAGPVCNPGHTQTTRERKLEN